MRERTCKECGDKYTPLVNWQKYCTKSCKFIAYGKSQKLKKQRGKK